MLALFLQLLVSVGLPLLGWLLWNRVAASASTPAQLPASRGGEPAPARTAVDRNGGVRAAKGEGISNKAASSSPLTAGEFAFQVESELKKLEGAASSQRPPTHVAPSFAATGAAPEGHVKSGGTTPSEILIAYATHSQNSLTLAHKLFSLLTAQLQTVAAVARPSGNGVVCPIVRINEMCEEEEESGAADAQGTAAGLALLPRRRDSAKNRLRVETLLNDNPYALIIFIVSTYTDGAAPPRSQTFEALLKDAFEDHRVPRNSLSGKRLAVFGLGDVAYGETNFNAFARHLHEWCRGLGAPAFAVPPVYATDAKAQSLFRVFSAALLKWVSRATFNEDGTITVAKKKAEAAAVLDQRARPTIAATVVSGETGSSDREAVARACRHQEDGAAAAPGSHLGGSDSEEVGDDVDDVEDLVWDGTDDAAFDPSSDPNELPELLYPKLRQSLEKQGYRLLGSHSGVKLCRWTKSMLRGQGGCYKHTFYNIDSSQCMEMTPSLACANKCVFCWRHHTNPISRYFRWKQDPPALLLEQGMAAHRQMIKQLRGVPGVTPERLEAAMHIRHCALSLVGEPIMYPRISEFCCMLHQHHISSFMVTNAQFPEQLRELIPVVQLYLSIDAPTPEELKRIDRPLFEDYWDRCLSCVRELAKKQQRTVLRLTLVNEYNTSNVAAYADLVQMGQPDFIEVKGVTYCGTSASSTLTMRANVPRHDEVIQFCRALCEELARRHPAHRTPQMEGHEDEEGDEDDDDNRAGPALQIPPEEWHRPYHVACEHEHSCCALIALDKFFYKGHWHTWINYERFYQLVESGSTDFTALDYAAVTPTWATYNAAERGFDPAQTRIVRKKARPTM